MSGYHKIKKDIIYDNCIIDKLKPGSSNELEKAISKKCKRISNNPSWWNRLWYDTYDQPEPKAPIKF